MAESLPKQLREIKHHELVAWSLIAFAILFIIWLLMRKQRPAPRVVQTPSYAITDLPSYSIGGNNLAIDRPPNGLPNVYNVTGPAIPPMMPGPPCACGCTDCGQPITYTFPSFGSLFNQTVSAIQAANQGLIDNFVNGLSYSERIFVTNNTPTVFAPFG